jgi:hypothetical protein
VAAGGALLATDAASSKDAWHRPRPFPALAEVFGWPTGREAATQPGEGIDLRLMEEFRAGHCCRRHGRGTAIYIPRIEYDWGEPEADNRDYRAYHWNRWSLPANGPEILSALRQIGYGQFFTTFPRWVVCEVTRPRNAPGLAVHAVNYRKDAPVGPAALSLRMPADWRGVAATALSPEWPGRRAVEAAAVNGRAEIATPRFDTYCLVHVETQGMSGVRPALEAPTSDARRRVPGSPGPPVPP